MFEAPEGLIVVQTAAGLNLYNPEKENFDRRPEPFLAKYEVSVELTDIIRDRDGGFWFVQPDKLMGEYGTFRRNGSNHVPLDLATHNDAVDYWITFVTRQTKANGIIPFWWDTGGVLDRKNNTVKDQRTIDAIIAGAK